MIIKKIANPDKGTSKTIRIRRLVDYIRTPQTENENEKCTYLGARGFLTDDLETQVAEMTALAHDAVRSSDPIAHYVISWQKGEHPTNAQVDKAVEILLGEMEVGDHQVIYALHKDTDNDHVHVALNRANPENSKVVKWKERELRLLHRACARIEANQGWRPEKNALYRVDESANLVETREFFQKGRPRPTQQQIDNERRTGEKSAARSAIETAGPIIERASRWEHLHRALARKGMRYTKKGSGATVQVGEVHVKASTVSRAAALRRVEARLGPYRSACACGVVANQAGVEPQDDANHLRFRSQNPVDALPFIETASSWEHLHHELAQRGMRYVKTGSGAAIFAGTHDSVSMKASAVSRKASLRRLEERLGPFVPAESDREPAPQGMPRWDEYATAGEGHRREMRLAWEAFEKERQEEEERLRREHREACTRLLREQSWKRRRGELRLLQSLLAQQRAKERAETIDELRRKRDVLRAQYGPWPDFGAWVDDPELAYVWRTRWTMTYFIEPTAATGHDLKARAKGDIRDYEARQVGGWVMYTTPAHRREGRVAFIDRGSRVTVHDRGSRSSTLAALQLASAKWGQVVVRGSERFKGEAARLAAIHGIEIVNPELQELIKQHRKKIEHDVAMRQDKDVGTSLAQSDPNMPSLQNASRPTARRIYER